MMFTLITAFLFGIPFIDCSWNTDVTRFQSQNYPCDEQAVNTLDDVVNLAAVLGDRHYKYPTNEQEALDHCKNDKVAVEWGKNYPKKCMTGRNQETSRHVTRLLMFSMEKVVKRRCRSETTRKLFIESGKCGNINAVKTQTIQCWNQYITDYMMTNKSKNVKIKNERHFIPLLCCQYHKFHDCFDNVYTDPKYSNECTSKAAQELESYIDESMYDVLQYLCGDYQEYSDKCDNLLNKYRDVWNTVKVGARPSSPLSNANDVFDSVPPVA